MYKLQLKVKKLYLHKLIICNRAVYCKLNILGVILQNKISVPFSAIFSNSYLVKANTI